MQMLNQKWKIGQMPKTEIKKQTNKNHWVIRMEAHNWDVQGDQVLIGATSSIDVK